MNRLRGLWSRLPAGFRAWTTDAAERVGASFVQAVLAAIGAGALSRGLNVPAVDALLIAGFTAALATGKALVAALVASRGASPAGLGLKSRCPSVSGNLGMLPAPHPSGKRTGAVITKDGRDYTPDLLAPKTADVSSVWRQTKSWPMLLNDQLGDCTIAGILHLYTILAAIAGRPCPAWSDADALRLYEKWAGYRPGVQSTDTGADPRQILLDAQKIGVDGIKIGPFASVPTGNVAAIRAALRDHVALYSALYLPDDYEQMGFRWVVQRRDPPDPNEGHCVLVVMHGSRFYAITWGGVATVSETFLTRYFALHFAVEGLAA